MKIWSIAACTALAFAVAHAQEPSGKVSAREACKPDVAKFCSDVKSGGGRVIACMKQHQDELSQPCKDAIGAHGGHKGQPPASGQDQAAPKPQ
jgi:Cysteine rich repeat